MRAAGTGRAGSARKVLIRAGLLVALATGISLAFSVSASAEVVDPSSAIQPTSMKLLNREVPPAVDPQWLAGESAGEVEGEVAPVGVEETAMVGEEASGETAAVATPAPEHMVRPVPAHLARHDPAEAAPASALERVARSLRAGSEQVGSFLGRVVSACQVGFGSGAGGPVLVLAVLGLAVALARHRVLGIRSATDEDMPRFLYAWELTPPG